jgi:penicillin-binding protein 2
MLRVSARWVVAAMLGAGSGIFAQTMNATKPAAKRSTHAVVRGAVSSAHHAVAHAGTHLAARAGTAHATATHVASRAATMPHRAAASAHATIASSVRAGAHAGRLVGTAVRRRVGTFERFTASSFNPDPGAGDVVEGEDPVVRAAALQALGNMNGTALAIDPSSGRILAMVNQHLALSAGAEPCSTIKVAVALAALKEGLVTASTPVNLGGRYNLDLTHAMAKSVNLYFETLGRAMGFETVKTYANWFGLGELAGYNIEGEQLGTYPDTELPQAAGGVGKMCSFGESISMTPLQLGALVSAIANGGTLYYLQHPTTAADIAAFEPKVKRLLDIQDVIPEILPGMQGAVTFPTGTARSLRTNFAQFPVFGKTGTCSNAGTRYGWFVSYADAPTGRIVTVIFLEGNRAVFGPKAAELTGAFYRAMYERNYFEPKTATVASRNGGR